MKILIVSGFLGAGKTTFIKEMSRTTGKDFVIYENEYGGAGIDTTLLENESLSVWESIENCVCCSGKQDFASAILTISSLLDPEFLIVEPTGVARLSAILQNINRYKYGNISLLAPVVIVDSVNYKHQIASSPDLWQDQIIEASTVVLSKTNRVSSEELGLLKKDISSLNPSARIYTQPFDSLPKEFFLSLLNTPIDPTDKIEDIQATVSDAEMVSFTLKNISLPTPTHLISFLNMLVSGEFGHIVRSKGYMPCGTPQEWLKFDLVGREWALTGMLLPEDTDKSPSVITFIGNNIKRHSIRQLLLFCGNADSPKLLELQKVSGR